MPKKLELSNLSVEKIDETEKEMLSVKRTNTNALVYKNVAEQVSRSKSPEQVKVNLGKMSLTQARSVSAELRRFLPDSFGYKPVPRTNGEYAFIGFVAKE